MSNKPIDKDYLLTQLHGLDKEVLESKYGRLTPSIGEVTTVDSNELASASVSVNTETKEAVFNFAIPKGNKGLDGVQISDNETVENKTWSSSKIASEIPTVTNDLTNELKSEYDQAVADSHIHSNKTILDNTTASYTTAEKTKLNSIGAVGAIYKSTSSTNPSTIFDGTWTLVHSGYERQQIGTQVLYGAISGDRNVGKTNLIGAYNYELIAGLFSNISVPSGCHKEYRITFQGRTQDDNHITIYLNNIATSSVGTWSSETFRVIGSSQFFKESDITLEPTMGYLSPGCNLKYQVTGIPTWWNIRNISVSGFIVTDAQIYTWRRTA